MSFSFELVNKNLKKFQFQDAECRSGRYSLSSKIFKQSLPYASADDAIIINLGQEKIVSFPFSLRNTTGDASAGTHTSEVKTIQEKITFLIEDFITKGVQDLYTINLHSTNVEILDMTGIIENFSLEFSGDTPSTQNGSISISIGGGQQ